MSDQDDDRSRGDTAGDERESTQSWRRLAAGYESARARDDSLDRILEWPAQRRLIGDIAGRSVLDVGCGDGSKVAQLVREGAAPSVGLDVSDQLISDRPTGLELLRGDMSTLDEIPALRNRRFDRILFLQSIGYAVDPICTLRAARAMLTDSGFIILSRTQPVRYAAQLAEENGTSLGQEYFRTTPFSFRHTGWDDRVTLTKQPYTMSDLINMISAAGLMIETAEEPRLSEIDQRRFPHKQAWLDKYLGILIFVLRPRPDPESD